MWAPDYLSLAEAKDYLRVPAGDTIDDAWITDLVTSASRAIDDRCNRQFGTAGGTRSYEQGAAVPDLTVVGAWLLVIDDLRADTTPAVTVGGVLLDPAGYTLLPIDAPFLGRPYTALRLMAQPSDLIAVTTTGWGWETVPAQVRTACRLQLGRWFVRRESPFGVAGSPSDGTETRLLARLDPDVATSLVGLSRMRRPA